MLFLLLLCCGADVVLWHWCWAVVQVDLGHCKTAQRVPCPSPHNCNKNFVDHLGYWYCREGHDSLFVPDKSMPATNTREWCVADPSRIRVIDVKLERFTKQEQ